MSPSNLVSSGISLWARRWLENHGGFGHGRKGPRITVFSARSNISGLCTNPVPDPMWWRGLPGWAPQGVIPIPYPAADQVLSDTVP